MNESTHNHPASDYDEPPRRRSRFGGWLVLLLGLGATVSLVGSFPFWGGRSFVFLLFFVLLFPATVIAALMRWWPQRDAQKVGDGIDWRRRLHLSAAGLAIAATVSLLLGIAWFGTAAGTMLTVAGTMLLPPVVILLLLTFSTRRERGTLAESMLDPGEEVVYQAQVHWGVFLPTIGVITVILLLTLAPLGTIGYGVATVLYLIVLPGTAAHALSIFFNTELEVTQNQMAAATGLIVRTFRVLDRDDIQAVGVYQGWLGKLFGYGRMSFICRDGFGFKVPGIVDPEGVRKILSTR